MNRFLFPDYESLSRAAADQIHLTVTDNPKAKLCLATGSTPTRTYERLAELAKENGEAFNSVFVIKLDEWIGLAQDDEATCGQYLKRRVIEPLSLTEDRLLAFKSDAPDRARECARVQTELDRIGPIDLCLLGLGANGHLGFNEPGESVEPHVHVATLAEETKQHKMVKSQMTKPSHGYTLGLGDLLHSKRILLLVSGKHKESQLKRLLQPRIETTFPASFLWLHQAVDLYYDFEPA
jgi:galactosamine-6-phosphate isomerase